MSDEPEFKLRRKPALRHYTRGCGLTEVGLVRQTKQNCRQFGDTLGCSLNESGLL